jgi:hypothetical protein
MKLKKKIQVSVCYDLDNVNVELKKLADEGNKVISVNFIYLDGVPYDKFIIVYEIDNK